MPTNFKAFKLAIAVAVLSLTASPAFARMDNAESAQPREKKLEYKQASSTPKNINKDFCTRLEKSLEKVQTRVMEKREGILQKKDAKVEDFKERRTKQEAKLQDFRDKADDRRSDRYDGLKAKAVTEAQKQAVEKFIKAIEAAVEKRQAAIDAAIEAFQTSVDTAAKDQQNIMKQAADTLKTETEAAVAKAKADCASGVEANTVKQQFESAMKAAKEKFEATRKSLENLRSKLEGLRKTRDEAVRKAIETFKSEVHAATKQLKEAFKLPTSATSTPPSASSTNAN